MTEAEHAKRLARIKAQRAAAGRPAHIETFAVYALIAAVIDAQGQPESKARG